MFSVAVRFLERFRELVAHKKGKVCIAAVAGRITEGVPVDRNDSIRIFCNDIPIGIHAESADPVAILLGCIYEFGFIDFICDIFKDLSRHFDTDTDINLVVCQVKSQLFTFLAEPFGTGAARSTNEVGAVHRFFLPFDEEAIAILFFFDMGHLGIAADFNAMSQKETVDASHQEAVVIGPQMTDLRVEQMQVIAQRFFPNATVLCGKDFPRRRRGGS